MMITSRIFTAGITPTLQVILLVVQRFSVHGCVSGAGRHTYAAPLAL